MVGALIAVPFAWTKFEIDVSLGSLTAISFLLALGLSLPLFNKWRRGEKRDRIDEQLRVIVIIIALVAVIAAVAYLFLRRSAG